MADDRAFADLQRLRAHLAAVSCGKPSSIASSIAPTLKRLGGLAVPLLVRALAGGQRAAASACLLEVARLLPARTRIIAELRDLAASSHGDDELTVVAVGILSALGERSDDAVFADPQAVSRRSACALVNQLDGAARVAQAAAVMVETLSEADLIGMTESIAEADRARGHALYAELAGRLDLPAPLRQLLASRATECAPEIVAAPLAAVDASARAAVLVDGAARVVVIVTATEASGTLRRFAVLIDETGMIDECLADHLDAGPAYLVDQPKHGQLLLPGVHARAHALEPSDDPMLAALLADGYQVSSRDLARATAVVTAATRRTVERGAALPPAYYLGRDLLGLAHEHAGQDRTPHQQLCSRALELLAAGESDRALPLLQRCATTNPDDAEIASALGLCLLNAGRSADAQPWLARASVIEPGWPLHHWNLAAAGHANGEMVLTARALGDFLRTSARSRLLGDAAQDNRLLLARAFLDDYRRFGRLSRQRKSALRREPRPASTRSTARATSRRAARADTSPSPE